MLLTRAVLASFVVLAGAGFSRAEGREGGEEPVEERAAEARESRGPREARCGPDGCDQRGPGMGEGLGRREGPMGGPRQDPEMREKLEKVRELEGKARELGRRLREADASGKAAAKAEAKQVLGELFDAKLAMQEEMLKKMEKHVAELREKVAKKKFSRERMIEKRLAMMAGEDEALDW